MLRPLTAAALVAIALATVTSCDRGDEASDRLTACEVVSIGEVERILGGDVAAPDATEYEGADALAGRTGCAWATDDGSKAILVQLVRTEDMSRSVRRTGFSADARFRAARSRNADAPSVDIGDAGFWVEEAATLHVVVAHSYLTAEVAVPRAVDAEDAAMAFVRQAVSRLTRGDGQTGGSS